MSKIFIVMACLGLSGCIAPPIVTYISLAMDGVSFVATGKSVGDHALSAAVNEDCAVLRVITEQDVKAVCREYDSATESTRLASIEEPAVDLEPGKVPPPADVEPEAVLPTAFTGGSVLSGATNEAGDNQQATFLMIGNFASLASAEALAAKMDGMPAVAVPAMAGDALYFRVVAGPIAPGESDAAQTRLAAFGIENSWLANLCTRNLGAPPCEQPYTKEQ